MDDGTNIQARPSPTVFEIVISGLLIARARARHTFALLASELRTIAQPFPSTGTTRAAHSFALAASALRAVIVPVGTFSGAATRTAYALTGSALRTVVVQVNTVQASTRCGLALHASTLTVVTRPVTPSRDAAAYSFSLTTSALI